MATPKHSREAAAAARAVDMSPEQPERFALVRQNGVPIWWRENEQKGWRPITMGAKRRLAGVSLEYRSRVFPLFHTSGEYVLFEVMAPLRGRSDRENIRKGDLLAQGIGFARVGSKGLKR